MAKLARARINASLLMGCMSQRDPRIVCLHCSTHSVISRGLFTVPYCALETEYDPGSFRTYTPPLQNDPLTNFVHLI
jgi:hypothetical protein